MKAVRREDSFEKSPGMTSAPRAVRDWAEGLVGSRVTARTWYRFEECLRRYCTVGLP